MKKKTLSVLLSSLLAVSLTGVGFAAWIITGDATDQTGNGTVSVETIDDRRVSLAKDDSKTNDTTVVFGHPANTSAVTGTPWLQVGDDMKAEDLSATFYFKITNAKYANVSVTYDDTLKGFIDDKYITFDYEVTYATGSDATAEQGLTLQLNFGWGEKFDTPDSEDSENPNADNLNPYIFYNNHKTVADASEAIATMNALKALTAFTITLSATYQAA